MRINQCGSAIYKFGETPKLACVVSQEVETEEPKYWDRTITIGTLSMKKLLTLHDYNIPETGEHQKQNVICFENFFVVDTTKRSQSAEEARFFDTYSYDGTHLLSSNKPWEDQDQIQTEQTLAKIEKEKESFEQTEKF
ncbi:MAG: hypothetical protein IJW24_00600 [Clostridia bacterium]|nr:hypothetical protein [Clostridia bacterium]